MDSIFPITPRPPKHSRATTPKRTRSGNYGNRMVEQSGTAGIQDERISIQQPSTVGVVAKPRKKSVLDHSTSQTAARVMMRRMSRALPITTPILLQQKEKCRSTEKAAVHDYTHAQIATSTLQYIENELKSVGQQLEETVDGSMGPYHSAKLQVYREAFQQLICKLIQGPWQDILCRIKHQYEVALEQQEVCIRKIPTLELEIQTLQEDHKFKVLSSKRSYEATVKDLETRLEVIRDREQVMNLKYQQEIAKNASMEAKVMKLDKSFKEMRLSNTHLIAGLKRHEAEKLKLETQNEKLKREHALLCQEFEKLRVEHEQTIAELVSMRMNENKLQKSGIGKMKDTITRLSAELDSVKAKLSVAESHEKEHGKLQVEMAKALQRTAELEQELKNLKEASTPRPDWGTLLQDGTLHENRPTVAIVQDIISKRPAGDAIQHAGLSPAIDAAGQHSPERTAAEEPPRRRKSQRKTSLGSRSGLEGERGHARRGSRSSTTSARRSSTENQPKVDPSSEAALVLLEAQQGRIVQQALRDRHLQAAELAATSRPPMIPAQGCSDQVPKYLQMEGAVRNLELSKRDTERLVKDCWMQKDKERDSSHLEDFFYSYLLRRFRSHGEAVEWGYNMVAALERYRYDSDCDLFLRILRHEADERLQWEQAEMLHGLQQALMKVDAEKNKGCATKVLPRIEFLQVLREYFPNKPVANTRKLEKVLFFEATGMSVNYEKLFEEDREGNQGEFCETLREQFVEEELERMESEKARRSSSEDSL